MTFYKKSLILLLSLMLSSPAFSFEESQQKNLTDHQQWLKDRFNDQHNKLIPVVAVADMLFACNQANGYVYGKFSLKALITEISKERLAEKLESCLADESIHSDIAINYGLLGCFHDQLDGLKPEEKAARIKLVKKAMASLSLNERKQSFTQCVTDQSIAYLK